MSKTNTPSQDGPDEVLEPMEAPKRLAFQHYFPHAWHLSYIIFGCVYADTSGAIPSRGMKSRHQKQQNP
jgi:hypothetical protein